MFKVIELLKATQGKLTGGFKDLTIKNISIDSRAIGKEEAFLAIKGSNFNGHDFIDEALRKGASCIIKEISYNRQQYKTPKTAFIEVPNTKKALGDIANFQRKRFDVPVVAVTGSNGKTTTKEMIAHILSKKFNVLKNDGTKNNQIGLPLTLLNLNGKHDLVVLEIGTNHFGEVEYLTKICEPNLGVITNIGPAHLEYFNDLKGVLKEKSTLLNNLDKPYIAVLNTDDGLLRSAVLKKTTRPFVLGFGIKNNCDFFASGIRLVKKGLEFTVNSKQKFSINNLGYHNIYNALAATAVVRVLGMGYKDIVSRLTNFEFPQGRLRLLKLAHINILDDTYNSNPFSLKEALDTLERFGSRGRKIFIMGDMLELGEGKESFHWQAGHYAARVCDAIVTVGKLSKLAAHAARSYGFNVENIFTCSSCGQARKILFNKIYPNKDDIILIKGSRMMAMENVFKETQGKSINKI